RGPHSCVPLAPGYRYAFRRCFVVMELRHRLLRYPQPSTLMDGGSMAGRNIDVVAFTRQLVDIESVTGNEGPVGSFLHRQLTALGYQAQKMTAEMERCNIYATVPGQPPPQVVFSTHMDTVPPFIPSWEDADHIYGR